MVNTIVFFTAKNTFLIHNADFRLDSFSFLSRILLSLKIEVTNVPNHLQEAYCLKPVISKNTSHRGLSHCSNALSQTHLANEPKRRRLLRQQMSLSRISSRNEDKNNMK